MNQSDKPLNDSPSPLPDLPDDLGGTDAVGNEPAALPENEQRKAEARLRASMPRRERVKDKIERRDFKDIDSPERVRARVDRMMSDPIAAKEIDTGVFESLNEPGEDFDESVLERIINGENFLGASFFDLGKRAAQCIVRVDIRTPEGRSGSGTASMVTNRLLMTNNHVLPKKEWAARSSVTFDFEDDIDGNPRQTVTFKLDPETFYVTDKTVDFAIVAVKEISSQPPGIPLSNYGFNPLDKSPGKIAIGESINIIQHPSGMHKQVVLQENRLLDLPKDAPDWLHYESDTLPGSSGAPLFNNRWEVVGLHHAGWAERDEQGRILTKDGRVWEKSMGEGAINWLGNEGARISRVVIKAEELARAQGLTAEQEKLLDELVNPSKRGAVVTPVGPSTGILEADTKPNPVTVKTDSGQTEQMRKDLIPQSSGLDNAAGEPKTAPTKTAPTKENLEETRKVENKDEFNINASGSVQLTIPLHITVQLGNPVSGAAAATNTGAVASSGGAAEAFGGSADLDDLEAILIDPDYSNRKGYDPQFLGVEVQLPELTDAQRRDAAINTLARDGDDPTVLPYNHFSLVINRKRRMAYYTACNIDGERAVKIKRKEAKNDRDKWSSDPRIPVLEQTAERHYAHRKIDRGHLVRREDPNWGESYEEAKKANDDTFHFTNCTPQHSDFNQRKDSWQGIENFILSSALAAKRRINLFTGPILDANDPKLNGVNVPLAFWKIVVFKKPDGSLSATAYVLEQGALIEDILEATFEADTFQVAVREIVERTGLDFNHLVEFDSLGKSDELEERESLGLEGAPVRIKLNSIDDIQL